MYNAKTVNQEMNNHIDSLEMNRIKNMFTGQDPEDILELAQLYIDTGEFERSRDYCHSYLNLCKEKNLPVNISIYKYLAYAYLSENKKDVALGYLSRYLKSNKAPDADTSDLFKKLKQELYSSTPQ